MKDGGVIYLIFVFLTVSTGANGLTTNYIRGGDINGIHGQLSRRNQGFNYPEVNYDIFQHPSRLALRQGQTGTTGGISGTTSATTLESEYIPYWPHGQWVFSRKPGYRPYCPDLYFKYGEVCGRKFNPDMGQPLIYKSFKNMCELEKENWREYRHHKSLYLKTGSTR